MGVFDRVSMGSVILRVADIGAAVEWYRANFGIEPLHLGVDGEHRIAAYGLAGLVVSLWELPSGCKKRPNVDVCAYPVFVTDDLEAAHDAVVSKGITTTEIRKSAATRFFQVSDLDGNRWEFAEVT